MRNLISYHLMFIKSIMILICFSLMQGHTLAQKNVPIKKININTYDGLILPAQVIEAHTVSKKIIIFINGSTPYDEKGHKAAIWNNKGEPMLEKQDFYQRFLEWMPLKGYTVATMAKRSFVYPQKLPRPTLDDLALDIVFFIEELKKEELLLNEENLVIVGYSEGSTVATKVLGLLKEKPAACILLGSGSSKFNYNTQSWEEWYMVDVLRRLKSWSDEQIQEEFKQFGTIMTDILTINEDTFENEWKKNGPFGFGFAPWESYHIDREVPFYDCVPNLLESNIPILICIGEDDMAMPMVLARRTYESLLENGYPKATFRVIEDEVHQYKKYDVFGIMDAWLSSKFQSTDFILQKSDSLMIEKHARANELIKEIYALPDGGGNPQKVLSCYQKAIETKMSDMMTWFILGVRLFTDGYNDEAYNSFAKATDTTFVARFASMVWMGHLKDLKNQRKEAISFYKKALDAYPGFPAQHDQWNIIIDKAWIEERLKTPFKGIQKKE